MENSQADPLLKLGGTESSLQALVTIWLNIICWNESTELLSFMKVVQNQI